MELEKEEDEPTPDEDKSQKSDVSKGFFQKVNLEGLMVINLIIKRLSFNQIILETIR